MEEEMVGARDTQRENYVQGFVRNPEGERLFE
jgi:hypothetical protein